MRLLSRSLVVLVTALVGLLASNPEARMDLHAWFAQLGARIAAAAFPDLMF